MDRYWLLTTTFYGNWLPGDPRGFVSRVRDRRPEDLPSSTPSRREHNVLESDYDRDLVGLHRSSSEKLKGGTIRIGREQAQVLQLQIRETATHRHWHLLASAILANHVHLVVGVEGDPDPTKILGDFKAYGSRALSKRWGTPPGGTWWTYAGSKRKLADESNLMAAVTYVRNQEHPLLIWVDPEFKP